MRVKKEQYEYIKPTEKEILFFERWSLRRTLPKWKYILYNGVLKEVLILFIIIKLLQYLFLSDASRFFYSSNAGVLFLIFEIFFWLLGGFVVGWFKFNSNEIEYELIKGIRE